jgi:hypothetical protein
MSLLGQVHTPDRLTADGTLGADDDGQQVSAQSAQTCVRRAIGDD